MNVYKALRLEAGLTLRQVEQVTGISNAYLSQLESDKIGSPSAKLLFTLARFYHVDLEKTLTDTGEIAHTDIGTVREKYKVQVSDLPGLRLAVAEITLQLQQVVDFLKTIK